MPNTLVHLGLQTLASRAVLRSADFKWIAVGCIIPDFPWIMQRIFLAVNSGADQYVLLNYFSVLASFFGSLLLCGALALLVADSRRIFLLLAGNSFMHLLLDSLQVKWANGVHLFAPFSWRLTGFNLIWPEHIITYVLTFFGVLVLFWYGWRDRERTVVLMPSQIRHAAAFLLAAIYLAIPFAFTSQLYAADNHFTATLSNRKERPGKYVEFDRAPFRSRDHTLRGFNGERIRLQGPIPSEDSLVSVRGNFIDSATIHVNSLHVHRMNRDLSSIIALAGVLLVWFTAMVRKRIVFSRVSPGNSQE